MKLTITIEMDNAAFFESDDTPARNAEAAKILHTLAGKIENAWEMEPDHGFRIQDTNGNKVGEALVSDS